MLDERLKLHGKARSGHWPVVRRDFLAGKVCAVCGGTKHLEAHHVKPFHLYPELELDPANLVALCENKNDGVNCHLLFGHLGKFSSVNSMVRYDVVTWSEKIKRRP